MKYNWWIYLIQAILWEAILPVPFVLAIRILPHYYRPLENLIAKLCEGIITSIVQMYQGDIISNDFSLGFGL